MKKQPLCLCCSIFLVLVVLVVGFVVYRKFFTSLSSEDDYDAEVDVQNVGNLTASTLWDLHRDIKTKNKFKIHLFHVLNPDNVLNGSKPQLKQVGPYTYDQLKTRLTLGIYPESDSVRYKDHVMYYFNPEESKGNDSDIVTIINMPWVGLAQEVSTMSAFSRYIVMAIVSRYHESVFMTRSIGDLLFGGFYHELISTFSGITGETYMPNNTFGLFYGRNDTYLDAREVNLGLKNPLHFGHTLKWKGVSELKWWNGKNLAGKSSAHEETETEDDDDDDWFGFGSDSEENEVEIEHSEKSSKTDDKSKKPLNSCNQISESSDWSLFHPGISKTETISVFDDGMCRNLKLAFEKEVVFNGGVTGYRFIVPRKEYGNPRLESETSCYCTHPGDGNADCPKDGAYQMNACQKGAYVLMSHPHFYNGDPSYISDAEDGSLNPNPNLHSTFIDIEPNTGVVLRYFKRVQVNLLLRPIKSISDFNHVPHMVFPVMWTEESAQLEDEALTELKNQLDSSNSPKKSSLLTGIKSLNSAQNLGLFSQTSSSLFLPAGIAIFLLVALIVAVVVKLSRKKHTQIPTHDDHMDTDWDEKLVELQIMDQSQSQQKNELLLTKERFIQVV